MKEGIIKMRKKECLLMLIAVMNSLRMLIRNIVVNSPKLIWWWKSAKNGQTMINEIAELELLGCGEPLNNPFTQRDLSFSFLRLCLLDGDQKHF